MKRFLSFISAVNNGVGVVASILCLLNLVNVFYDAIARYFLADLFPFRVTSIGLQELEWHFFSATFMLGMAYALKKDGHVRVDIFYDKFSSKKKAMVNIFGTVVFLLPFIVLILIYGFNFAQNSFFLGEQSGDPGGLPYRFIIKSFVPLSGFFLLLSSIEYLAEQIYMIKTGQTHILEREKL